jgi:hypothetical protein
MSLRSSLMLMLLSAVSMEAAIIQSWDNRTQWEAMTNIFYNQTFDAGVNTTQTATTIRNYTTSAGTMGILGTFGVNGSAIHSRLVNADMTSSGTIRNETSSPNTRWWLSYGSGGLLVSNGATSASNDDTKLRVSTPANTRAIGFNYNSDWGNNGNVIIRVMDVSMTTPVVFNLGNISTRSLKFFGVQTTHDLVYVDLAASWGQQGSLAHFVVMDNLSLGNPSQSGPPPGGETVELSTAIYFLSGAGAIWIGSRRKQPNVTA